MYHIAAVAFKYGNTQQVTVLCMYHELSRCQIKALFFAIRNTFGRPALAFFLECKLITAGCCRISDSAVAKQANFFTLNIILFLIL